jgi:hypothetical protein
MGGYSSAQLQEAQSLHVPDHRCPINSCNTPVLPSCPGGTQRKQKEAFHVSDGTRRLWSRASKTHLFGLGLVSIRQQQEIHMVSHSLCVTAGAQRTLVTSYIVALGMWKVSHIQITLSVVACPSSLEIIHYMLTCTLKTLVSIITTWPVALFGSCGQRQRPQEEQGCCGCVRVGHWSSLWGC